MVTKQQLKSELQKLGIEKGMTLEVHSSLSSFGELEGGAETVIDTLKELVTEEGSIFMPALRLSKELDLTEEDKELGITVKIRILPSDAEKTAMGIVADTFRKLPDTYTGTDTISTSGWGKHGKEALTGGLDYPIHNGGKALLLGVDIYKLTAMHYVEGITPDDINEIYAPTEEINKIYPPEEWMIEAGHPPVKAWYKIQKMAYERGLIKEAYIGDCKVMFFDIWSVISLYEKELKQDPYGLWGMYFKNAYFIIGTSYAGKSTMVKELAKKHNGIACEENYHDNYPGELDSKEFPCLTYTRDLEDWHDFIRRSPQEYKDWIDGVKKECEILELRMLPEICDQGKKVFVDTNISIETLRKIAPLDHTLVMLADPEIPLHRFFDRPDPEKQFLYKLIMEEPDPDKAMENYRQGLKLICSQEDYDELENSGFSVIYRDENRTIEQTVSLAEKALGLNE